MGTRAAAGARPLIHVDLCTGIGGFVLAGIWAGFTPALFCEIDPYCQKVLAKHWPEVPIHDNLHTLDAARYPGAVRCGLLTAGIPCQPFSVAGKRLGTADDRHLWPALRRVLHDVRPGWIVIENVGGFTDLALDLVLADVEADGYTAGAIVLPAAGVGAPHMRHRCFIIAHLPDADRGGRMGRTADRGEATSQCGSDVADPAPFGCERRGDARTGRDGLADSGAGTADADSARLAQRGGIADSRGSRACVAGDASCTEVPDTDRAWELQPGGTECDERGWTGDRHPWFGWDGRTPLESIWESEPAVRGMDDEFSAGLDGYRGRLTTASRNRAKQLAALGNALPPMLVYPVLAAIAAHLTAPPDAQEEAVT